MYRLCETLETYDALNAVFTELQQRVEPRCTRWSGAPMRDYEGRLYILVHPAAPAEPGDLERLPEEPLPIRHFVPLEGNAVLDPYPMEGAQPPMGFEEYFWGDNLRNIKLMAQGQGIDVSRIDAYSQRTGYSTPPKVVLGYLVALTPVPPSPNAKKPLTIEPVYTYEQRLRLEASLHGTEGGAFVRADRLITLKAALDQGGYDTTPFTPYLPKS